MKRCPTCNRVETDDTLAFCRADGPALITDSGSIGGDAGTAKFGSAPVSSEIETSVLPHRTDADMSRSTTPTTVLRDTATPNTTRELAKSQSRGVVFGLIALVILGVVIGGYFYFSRKTTAAIQSIAVMPFINESGNSDVEYLSDGMTETLINSLSQVPGVSVKARSSVFRYKGKDADTRNIAKDLGVQALLSGRIVQRGDLLTLSVELIDGQTENVLWGNRYERKLSELVTLQRDVGPA